ncbi:MAG: biotin--[acetyl-CoA-carboxylase] ligase [Ignavibacteriales bacterium]|nr:biotin--[acetyl-CoA-carboxylase] ligase [Ignavibacteriales bacterium]
MLFNFEDFDIRMETEFIGKSFYYIDEVDSTNSILLNNEKYDQDGTVILAEQQTAGRGRMKRKWVSERGKNLTFSILISDNISKINVNFFNLCAGLAIANAIENLFQLPAKLKWPNDVLISNKKVAGLLLESISSGDRIKKIIIGFGININQTHFPFMDNLSPTSIRIEVKKEVSREKILSEILNQYEELLEIAKKEPNKIIYNWKEKCLYLGERIQITINNEQIIGIFEDIDDEGFLLLKVDNKIQKLYSGEISESI